MPILNYTTSIDAWKTVNEIQQILSKHKITHINIRNEGSFPVALSFTINFKEQPLNFVLPCNYAGVLAALKRSNKVPHKLKNSEQALRVSWRIVKDWVEAQLAIVEADLAPMEEVFLPYLVTNEHGQTLSQRILQGDGMKLLSG